MFEAPGRLGSLLSSHSRVFWCALGAQTPKGTPLCGEHLVYSHPPWTTKDCVCKRRSNNYAADSGEGYEQFILQALTHHDLLKKQDWKQTSTQWHALQRELKTKEGARAFFQSESILLNDELRERLEQDTEAVNDIGGGSCNHCTHKQ